MIIFIADDEKRVLNTLVKTVREVLPQGKIYSFSDGDNLLETANRINCDIAFLDVEMGAWNGIDLAKAIKKHNVKSKIIFITGYINYAFEAIQIHADGFLQKPVIVEDIEAEIEYLYNSKKCEVHINCFGNFDVFVNDKILTFGRNKAKEILAYLVDRKGSSATLSEISAVLFEDANNEEKSKRYAQTLLNEMNNSLKNAGIDYILKKSRNSYAIDIKKVSCDYYDFLENNPIAVRTFTGEYMSQYSWAESTLAYLLQM